MLETSVLPRENFSLKYNLLNAVCDFNCYYTDKTIYDVHGFILYAFVNWIV